MKEDAKKKYCPFVAIGLSLFAMLNKQTEGTLANACIASDCMMWRRDGLYSNTPVSGRLVESGKSDSDGYCGLAGKE